MTGFRYALVLEDGEPADPAVFATIFPRWQEGVTFLAGTDLHCFRILEIAPGFTLDDVQSITGAKVLPASGLKEVEL